MFISHALDTYVTESGTRPPVCGFVERQASTHASHLMFALQKTQTEQRKPATHILRK